MYLRKAKKFTLLCLSVMMIMSSLVVAYAEETACNHHYAEKKFIAEPSIYNEGVQLLECTKCGNQITQRTPRLNPYIKVKSHKFQGKKGKTYSIGLQYAPGDNVAKVKYSKKGIIKFNPEKGTFKCKKVGKTYLTVILDSGLSVKCKVVVKKKVKKSKKTVEIFNIKTSYENIFN